MYSTFSALAIAAAVAGCAPQVTSSYVTSSPGTRSCGWQHPCETQESSQWPQFAALPTPPTPTKPVLTTPIEYFDGQPLVRIGVPNVDSFRCVLDTGSNTLVIPMRIMKKLFDDGLPDEAFDVIGVSEADVAGGGSIKTLKIKFQKIQIGPWELHEVPATIVRDGNCLLGMSILQQFGHLTIDFGKQQLVLED
jgi:hypothetical protein